MSAWSLSKKFNAIVCGGTLHGSIKIVLAKPMTFMNESGQAVQMLAAYYQCATEDLLVVHDDKDLPLGDIRVHTGRGDAGHNGIKSIVAHLNTNEFTRVRLGIASKNEHKMRNTSAFVLKKFGVLEKRAMEDMMERAVKDIIARLTATEAATK